MAERATSTRSDPAPTSSSPSHDLGEELSRAREEILRLRDLLVGKDAELGALRGRLAELEAGSARLVSLAARVRRLVPRFLFSAAVSLRKRRGRRG